VPDLRNVSFQQNESTTLAVYFADPHNSHTFRPEESFEGFYGNSPVGVWTLTVIDTVDDGNVGTLRSWNISFTLEACNPTYTWRNLTTADADESWPAARFDHITIQHRNR
jgi:subtilisin-like proprotein convertase family protein